MTVEGRDKWDKIEIILKPIGGLFTALAVTALGYLTSQYLGKQQSNEARLQLYTQLMSQREQSESALRKDMFATIIQNFLTPSTDSLDNRVLNLELLAYNFHESLNLKPLFVHLNKQIATSKEVTKVDYSKRMERVAREISRRQLAVLEGVGTSYDRSIDFYTLLNTPGGIDLEPATVTLEGVEHELKIHVLEANPETREVKVRLEVSQPGTGGHTSITEFWVGHYDFPMIDNTRLPNDQRVTLVMNSYDDYSADITVAFFPGAYASLKEKPYFQEVVNQLLGQQ